MQACHAQAQLSFSGIQKGGFNLRITRAVGQDNADHQPRDMGRIVHTILKGKFDPAKKPVSRRIETYLPQAAGCNRKHSDCLFLFLACVGDSDGFVSRRAVCIGMILDRPLVR